MEGYFKKVVRQAKLLPHTSGFAEKTIPAEIRSDLFLGSTARILEYRRRLEEKGAFNKYT